MVDISILTRVYKPTYNWEAPHCGVSTQLKYPHVDTWENHSMSWGIKHQHTSNTGMLDAWRIKPGRKAATICKEFTQQLVDGALPGLFAGELALCPRFFHPSRPFTKGNRKWFDDGNPLQCGAIAPNSHRFAYMHGYYNIQYLRY